MTTRQADRLIRDAKPVTFRSEFYHETIVGTPILRHRYTIEILTENGRVGLFERADLTVVSPARGSPPRGAPCWYHPPTQETAMTVKEATRIAGWYDERMSSLVDDPMTEAMGAPVGDFAEEWSRKHRKMIGDGLKTATGKAREILLAALERYMP